MRQSFPASINPDLQFLPPEKMSYPPEPRSYLPYLTPKIIADTFATKGTKTTKIIIYAFFVFKILSHRGGCRINTMEMYLFFWYGIKKHLVP